MLNYLLKCPLPQGVWDSNKRLFSSAMEGKSSQFMKNIDSYISDSPSSGDILYNWGIEEMGLLSQNKNWWNSFAEGVNVKKTLTMLGALKHGVYVGVNTVDSGMDSSLYTRDINVLLDLFRDGFLEIDQIGLAKLNDALFGKRTYEGVLENKFLVVRLDVVRVDRVSGSILFKPVIPRSKLSIGLDKDYVFIPLDFMLDASKILEKYVGENAFTFIKTSEQGQIRHTATLSQNLVRKVYANSDSNLVENRLAKTVVGYDLADLRFMAYDLESPVQSIGRASFRLEMLDSVVPADLSKLDRSMHNIDYDILNKVFISKLNKFKLADFQQFNFIPTDGCANLNDRVQLVLEATSSLSLSAKYLLMKQYENLFGDIDISMANMLRVRPKIIKNLKIVPLSGGTVEAKKELQKMLDTGLVKITAISSRSGGIYERLCSNNKEILSRFLGDNYVAEFESPRYRLVEAKKELLSDGKKSNKQMSEIISKYNLLTYTTLEKGILTESVIDKAIEDLSNKDRNIGEDTVIYRNINATSDKDFYGSLKVGNVVAVEFASS